MTCNIYTCNVTQELPSSSLDDELLEPGSVQNQPNLDVPNQNFDLDDVSCNYYDHSLITNNL